MGDENVLSRDSTLSVLDMAERQRLTYGESRCFWRTRTRSLDKPGEEGSRSLVGSTGSGAAPVFRLSSGVPQRDPAVTVIAMTGWFIGRLLAWSLGGVEGSSLFMDSSSSEL